MEVIAFHYKRQWYWRYFFEDIESPSCCMRTWFVLSWLSVVGCFFFLFFYFYNSLNFLLIRILNWRNIVFKEHSFLFLYCSSILLHEIHGTASYSSGFIRFDWIWIKLCLEFRRDSRNRLWTDVFKILHLWFWFIFRRCILEVKDKERLWWMILWRLQCWWRQINFLKFLVVVKVWHLDFLSSWEITEACWVCKEICIEMVWTYEFRLK